MKYYLVLLFFSVSSVLVLQAQFGGNAKPNRVISYKKVGDVELKLHVFNPSDHQATDKAPVIVFFFGGGWITGTPRQFYKQSEYFASRGMVAISAEYRVSKKHKTTPKECVMDGKSAIRWVRAHAEELGIDPEKVIAAGGSAGGHVAAATGTVKEFDEPGEDTSVSCVPNAMVLFNPVFDNGPKGMRAAGGRCEIHIYEDETHGFFNKSKYKETVSEADAFLVSLGYLKAKEPSPKK